MSADFQMGAPRSARERQGGVALVLVLAFLVLISALIIGFFSSVQTDLQSSRAYGDSVAVKQLVATATNIVTGQISDGTKSLKIPQPPGTSAAIPPGGRLDWASQPGLIRTWDDTGAGWKMFKLYSSANMVADLSSSGYSASQNLNREVPIAWPAQPALYVDLNEPVLVPAPLGLIKRNGQAMRASYPILDPLALNQIDGFNITSPPGYSGPLNNGQPSVTESTDPTGITAGAKTSNPAPMPVAWMYVLKDGTLTVPASTADNGRTAQWPAADPQFMPAQKNPIVGRVAFWTDDESCKLNVNTASEPAAWDTPRAVSQQDAAYGLYQPANKEYQRYPGHPFMTALSPVLFPGNPTLTPAQKDLIYGLIPRVQAGGSRSGTVSVAAAQVITPDQDRLFANVDEFLFEAPPAIAGGANPSGTRTAVSDDTKYKPLNLDPKRLRRARFFLTANSSAPEINLYGGPRISLWPEWSTASKRTAFDKLAAFCTTLGDLPYYFQRADCTSMTVDWASIARNQSIYKLLQAETSANIPGFGGNFAAKFGADRDQILTEMFDYIRCTNLHDNSPGAANYAVNGTNSQGQPITGQVAPISFLPPGGSSKPTQGFGRFHTISQFGFHFICTQDGPKGSGIDSNGNPNSPLTAGQRRVQASFLFEPFSVSLGYCELHENISYLVTFKGGISLDGQPLAFPSVPVTLKSADQMMDINGYVHPRFWGGAGGVRGPINAFGLGSYPLISNRVQIGAANKSTMSFSGGTVEVKVFSGAGIASTPVQTFDVVFPPATVPIPALVATACTSSRTGAVSGLGATPNYWWDFASRYSQVFQMIHEPGAEYPDVRRQFGNDSSNDPPGFKLGSVFRQEDVVRSMVPVHGDLRIVAASSTPTQAVSWVPVGGWANPSQNFYHIFSDPVGTHAYYGFGNEPAGPLNYSTSNVNDQLTPASYYFSRLPEINAGAGRMYNNWGDFDNGVAHLIDGAYINKPDEGNTAEKSGSNGTTYSYFTWNYSNPSPVFFSPNRLVPSAGMFGSLPTGVKRNLPWQTLLFRPEVAIGKPPHPGLGLPQTGPPYATPPDHAIMDLFWMPVIEPYAISEPFSTSGKINLNYEIAPFTYIKRATAMYGALKSEQPLVIPNALSRVYKLWDHETSDYPWLPNDPDPRACQDPQVVKDWNSAINGTGAGATMRLPIDPVQTLGQCDTRFAAGQIFRAATQICDLHLVRQGEMLSNYQNGQIWTGAYVTGDNTRERPYANLYARLTTRSNTFTVHIRAQVLRQVGGPAPADWNVWREGHDQEVSEYRGSTIVEHYIDPADPSLPDFASNPNAVADTAYRFRVVASKKFAP